MQVYQPQEKIKEILRKRFLTAPKRYGQRKTPGRHGAAREWKKQIQLEGMGMVTRRRNRLRSALINSCPPYFLAA